MPYVEYIEHVCNALQCNPTDYMKTIPMGIMQRLLEGRKVEDNQRKQAILEIISDEYCRLILRTTMDHPKSAMEIAAESKIPISTVYRRLQTLHDNKLVGISGSISEDGKKYFLYKSKIKAISASCDCHDLEINIVPNYSISKNFEEPC